MQMPEEMQGEQQMAQDGGGQTPPENPILDAVRTIGTYIAALSEQGDPAATELQSIMSQFVQALGKKAGDGSNMAPQAEEQSQQPGMPQAQAPGGGRGVNPMLGNMSGGARAQRGQVSVI